MFRELLPTCFLDEAQRSSGIKRNNSLYSPLVVMWLMVMHRLHRGASLESAVMELLMGLPVSFWPNPCKRVRRWREHGEVPSSNTGAYNQARQQLPPLVVEQSCDRIFNQLISGMKDAVSDDGQRAFVLDGSSLRLAHSPSLCELYPPGSNRFGEGHWPLLRVLVAHTLHTGLAMRPVVLSVAYGFGNPNKSPVVDEYAQVKAENDGPVLRRQSFRRGWLDSVV